MPTATRSGFTLIELIVVITLIAAFSVVATVSFGGNGDFSLKTDSEQFLADVVNVKKGSLLLKKSLSSIVLYNQDRGYFTFSENGESYRLLPRDRVSGKDQEDYTFAFSSAQKGTAGYQPYSYLPGGSVVPQYRDEQGVVQSPTSTSAGTGTFDFKIPQAALKRDLAFYFQDQEDVATRSNDVRYRFFDTKNLNGISSDDISISLYSDSAKQKPLTASYVRINFDAFGKMSLYDPDGQPFPVQQLTIDFLSDAKSVYTLTLPDDLVKNT